MTKEELSRYFYIKKDIERINNKIKEIDDTFISANRLNGMRYERHLSNLQETRMMLVEKYQSILEEKKNEALKELIKIEEFISGIEDYEIKLIVSYRYVDLLDWNAIEKKVHISCRQAQRLLNKVIDN